ncbi:MAG: hypothetical protein ACI9EW_003547 [Cellvibrionaceae bacterium]|jgi:hypothetical protein
MIFEQALKLVSQSPENFAYHLILFLCLQISFGLSFWLWRNSPEDKFAKQLTIGTGAMLLIRLLWAVILILYAEHRMNLVPVDKGLGLISIAFLTWCMVPDRDEATTVRTISLFILTVGSLIAIYFAVLDWVSRINVEAYANTAQAPAWAGAGLVLTVICIVTLASMRPFDWLLRLAIVLPIGFALTLHFFAVSPAALISTGLSTQISTGVVPVWDRLAWLVTAPLLVALVYRRIMFYLLDQTEVVGKGQNQLATLVEQAVKLLESDTLLNRVEHTAELFDGLYGIQFLGLASFSNEDEQYADLAIMQKDATGLVFEEPRRWMLNLADWPFVLRALDTQSVVQLSPHSSDTNRKVYELHQELHLRYITPILTIPLVRGEQKVGFLLIGALPQQPNWPEEDRAAIQRLGAHITRSFLDREKITRLEFAEKGLGIVDDLEITAKIDALEEDNHSLAERLIQIQEKFREVQKDLKTAQKTLEKRSDSLTPELDELKQEVSVLREALIETEISLGDSQSQNKSTGNEVPTLRKYSQIISQYSSELELSQQRIEQLEFKLDHMRSGTQDTAYSSPGEEIRTPVALIQSYTDMLLTDNSEIISVRQVDLLQRIKNSTSRVSLLLDRLDSLWQERVSSLSVSDLDSVFTESITTLGEIFETRNIRLNIEMDEQFPLIPMGTATLNHIFTSVFSHTVSVMQDEGVLHVTLKIDEIENLDENEHNPSDLLRFLIFSTRTDNAVLPTKTNGSQGDQASIQLAADGVRAIVKAHAGRVWTDIDRGKGSYQTTIVLPLLETDADQPNVVEPMAREKQ